jgi:N-acetylneuraminic acid mutarotase
MARRLIVLLLLVVGLGVLAVVVLVVTNPAPRDAPGWSLAAPLPEGRGEVASAVADGRLFVIGGLAGAPPRSADEVNVYDAGSDAWTAAPALPEPRHHTAAAGLDGSVFVSGGASGLTDWTPLANLWQLPAGADSWLELPEMPDPRYGQRMVALDGLLYVVGGQGGSGEVLIYSPAERRWTLGAAMPAVRDHLAVVAVDDEIWAIGGRDGGLTARVDIYDPASDTWRDGPALPAATSGAAEGAGEGLIFVSGGEDPQPTGEGVFDRHWWLDTSDSAAVWQAVPPPPLAVHGAEGALIDGRFYIPGGASRAGGLSFMSWSDDLQVLEIAALR